VVFAVVVAAAGVERVSWLKGCWEMSSGGRTIEEQWNAPRGGVMLEVGRTVRDGRLVEYEFVVVREDGDSLAYEAHPSGQPSAVFRAKEVGEQRVVFENPEHDFPQRVGYERKSADALSAWIEGTANGRARRVDFSYNRVACP
jgi:hypothetical protein